MFKRTKIYLVLTLLVLTGFAGSLNSNSLTSKERKSLANELKNSKKALLQSIRGLSEAQLNFRPSPKNASIKECVYQLAISENNLRNTAYNTLKAPINSAHRVQIKITDEQLVSMMDTKSLKARTNQSPVSLNKKYKNIDDALEDFKTKRSDLIVFVKNTTDDLRNHVGQVSIGSLDSYQMLLLIPGTTNQCLRQIAEIKSHPKFPKN